MEPDAVLNAYVFIPNASAATLANLNGLVVQEPPQGGSAYAHFLFPLSGPDDAMLVVHAPDLGALQTFVTTTVWKAGATDTSTAIAAGFIIHWPKVTLALRFEAIVRGRLIKNGLAGLQGHLEGMSAYMGGATVLGEYDVILEFGADEYDDLVTALQGVYALEQLEWTITGVTEFEVGPV